MSNASQSTRSFAEQLRFLRGSVSLRELADLTRAADEEHGRGFSHAYLSRLERGLVPAVPAVMELIAKTFGIAPDEFVEYRLHTARLALDERHAGLDNAVDALRRFEPATVD
jgi:transcriptional regulator with XRE-family HTH domain